MTTDAKLERDKFLRWKHHNAKRLDRRTNSAQPQNRSLSNPWPLRALPHPLRKGTLVAYIRYMEDPWDAGRQLADIQNYCTQQGYRLERAFEDQGKPSFGLTRALQALSEADGLIAVDLDRFIQHEGDKTRDLRPLIHEFLKPGSKYLITIKEGVDTSSPTGQMSAIELINQPRDHGLDMSLSEL
jgi:hypothetical protein